MLLLYNKLSIPGLPPALYGVMSINPVVVALLGAELGRGHPVEHLC